MTQQDAVGGDEPIVADEPTIEDRFLSAFGEEPENKDPDGEPAPEAQEGEAPEVDDEPIVADEQQEESQEEELPPIEAPVSWAKDAKDVFGNLPREAQEAIATREADREKFIQSKSREAKQATETAQAQALEKVQENRQLHLQQLQALLPQIPQKPSAHLQYQDPQAYAFAVDEYEAGVAHYTNIVEQIEGITNQYDQAQKALRDHHTRTTLQGVKEALPEYFEEGSELKGKLESTARELGFNDTEMQEFEARHYVALNTVAGLKDKADKYDALMSQKMEKVREAKKLPQVSRPGTARGKGAVANDRYIKDREAMRSGDQDATTRVFGRFV